MSDTTWHGDDSPPMGAELEHVADGEWTRQAPHRYDVDTIDGAPCCPFDRGHPIHRQPELPPVPETLGPDRQQALDRGYAPEAEGCELCSYTRGGCSFCSGRSAIEVANERSDVAGVSVVDLTEVLDFQQRLADETAADT